MKQFVNGEKYYYRQLNSSYQKAYDELMNGFMNRKELITLHGIKDPDFRMITVYEAINKDHPDMFWPDYYQVRYTKLPRLYTVRPDYFFNRETTSALNGEVYAWKMKICSQIPSSLPVRERVWMIYDYLARQVTYKESDTRYSNTLIGPMKKNMHASVCEGVAKAFKFLCDAKGIPCIIVTGNAKASDGTSGPHAWNMVRIGDIYRHVDATWEINNAHYHGIADDINYLHKDSEMTKYTWDRNSVPECR